MAPEHWPRAVGAVNPTPQAVVHVGMDVRNICRKESAVFILGASS
jgi:hypothetical protein